ncbi:hypothetical protein [Kribbella shirazensis]|uniref:Putative cysteine cluster protein YcgN (CxxCxxCC family) n=1 Tax=Kribbella shirazensis TaxID=1105143 RepID=A0A7X5VEQ0_9ACTN|nr:hypothetical protein [Kribbella shirazensis]NIK59865.1 putative cysteine cluster protein YcgN (CxxCxxCC family) [Kribbella shirazensis]
MMKLVRRMVRLGRVEFCDGCGQVCTAQCRAEAHRDRLRARQAQFRLPL